MKIIEYFTSNDKAHWLEEIAKADWGCGEISSPAFERRQAEGNDRGFRACSAFD